MSVLFGWIIGTLCISGPLVIALGWAYNSPRFASKRISKTAPMRLPWNHRIKMMLVTTVISLSLVLGVPYLLFGSVLQAAGSAWWVIGLQVVGILLVYDFIYYWAHRFMHLPQVLRYVHGIHHRARNPSTLESFYQHPAELVLGLSLLFSCTWLISLIAPIDVWAYGITFFLYSVMNILVHSGLVFGSVFTKPIDYLTLKHYAHHMSDPEKNYSTLTPLPDMLFGTMVMPRVAPRG